MNPKVLVALILVAVATYARGDDEVHRTEAGDTLWDLSARYWHDAKAWPDLWALNPHFQNPHWISPGDPVYLHRKAATGAVRLPLTRLEAGEGDGTFPSPADTAEPGAIVGQSQPHPGDVSLSEVSFAKAQAQDFISPQRIPSVGVIRNRKLQKQIYGAGEIVEVDLPKGSRLAPGDVLTVYDDSGKVLHPSNRAPRGYHVRVLGHLRILSVAEGRAEGELLETYDAVEDRMLLMPHRAPVTRVVPLESKVRVEGTVIEGSAQRTLFSTQDIVFLDRGTLHGLRPGVLLDVPIPPAGRRAEGLSDVEAPLARLLVVSAEDKTSAGLVLESRTSLSVGDRFVAAAPR
ncbi:MAG: LysM peptidoglycan-binding domain-containing protein [Deltaproteobacteria bacterium]|nr:LysM peptidoglycan-binding domain-containing protein [Deltaproteobacteria bacterium]